MQQKVYGSCLTKLEKIPAVRNTAYMIEIFHSVIRGLVELPKQLRWSYLAP